MVENFVIRPLAVQDMQEGFDWYESKSAGLGREFLEAIDLCFSAIRKNPKAFTPVKEKYRRALVKRFPYAIYFRFEDDCVTIHSVFHTSQNPRKWMKRLSE
jgi:plasmid stabilization system protein ParE